MKNVELADDDQNFKFYRPYYKLWALPSLFVHSLQAKPLFRKDKKVIRIALIISYAAG